MRTKRAKRIKSNTQPLQTLGTAPPANGNGSGAATLRPEVAPSGRYRRRTHKVAPVLSENSTGAQVAAIPPDNHLEAPISGAHVLKTIRDEWEHGGKKLPTDLERAELLATFKVRRQATKDADAALKKARAEEAIHTLKLARAFGCQSLRVEGEIYDFASRGPAVFFRKRTVGLIDVV